MPSTWSTRSIPTATLRSSSTTRTCRTAGTSTTTRTTRRTIPYHDAPARSGPGVRRRTAAILPQRVDGHALPAVHQLCRPRGPGASRHPVGQPTRQWALFYTELENVGPTPVNFNNAQWQITVKQSPIMTAELAVLRDRSRDAGRNATDPRWSRQTVQSSSTLPTLAAGSDHGRKKSAADDRRNDRLETRRRSESCHRRASVHVRNPNPPIRRCQPPVTWSSIRTTAAREYRATQRIQTISSQLPAGRLRHGCNDGDDLPGSETRRFSPPR